MNRAIHVLAFSILLSVAVVPAAGAQCLVDVHGLDVDGNVITANIKNTGQSVESISYGLSVEKDGMVPERFDDTIELDPGEEYDVYEVFAFDTGHYTLTLEAAALCGFTDSESMGHIKLQGYSCSNPYGAEGETDCSYFTQQLLECSGGSWDVVAQDEGEYCYTCGPVCGDGSCNCGELPETCPIDCLSGECTQEWTSQYRCRDGDSERKYIHSDCIAEWRKVQDCTFGCSDGVCIGEPGPVQGCGVEILSLDYLASVVIGGNPFLTAQFRNTGTHDEDIALELKVGGSVRGTRQRMLPDGSSDSVTFNYTPPSQPGLHDIELKATADCGSTDTSVAKLTVTESDEAVVIPPAVIEPPEAPRQTYVDIYPPTLDLILQESKVFVVDISTASPQVFSISVSGVPQTWVEFSRRVMVDDDRTEFLYVTPEETGNRDITVLVRAETENQDFTKQLRIYVSPDTNRPDGDTVFGYLGDQISGFLSALSQNFVAVIAIIIILVIVVLAIAHRKLKTEYEDLF